MPGQSTVVTVCTSRQVHSFLFDEPRRGAHIKKSTQDYVQSQLRFWKEQKVVLPYAFLTGQQSMAKQALLEMGWKEVYEAHNYKYPDTSKTLSILVYDMNQYQEEVKEEAKAAPVVSPFAQQQEPEVVLLPISRLTGPDANLLGINNLRFSYVGAPKPGVWYSHTPNEQPPRNLSLDAFIEVVIISAEGPRRRTFQRRRVRDFHWTARRVASPIVAFRVVA